MPPKDTVADLSTSEWLCSREGGVGIDTVFIWRCEFSGDAVVIASKYGIEIGGFGDTTLINNLTRLNNYHMLLNLALVQVEKIQRSDPDMR